MRKTTFFSLVETAEFAYIWISGWLKKKELWIMHVVSMKLHYYSFKIICVLRAEYNCFETIIFPLPSRNLIELSGKEVLLKNEPVPFKQWASKGTRINRSFLSFILTLSVCISAILVFDSSANLTRGNESYRTGKIDGCTAGRKEQIRWKKTLIFESCRFQLRTYWKGKQLRHSVQSGFRHSGLVSALR